MSEGCKACSGLAEVVNVLQDFLPRCKQTGKVIFEIRSAPLIAEQMSKRTGENWQAVPCEACEKVHMWQVAATPGGEGGEDA